MFSLKKANNRVKNRIISFGTILFFSLMTIFSSVSGFAQTVLDLPVPGTFVHTSASFQPVLVKGIYVAPDNPLDVNFLFDMGDKELSEKVFRTEADKIIKYFLASLAVPRESLWVNLSPYERNRIVPDVFGQTEMGRDLLAQDYLLKQLTVSLMNPEDYIGRKFWERVQQKAQDLFGTTEIPTDSFHKIWIVPEEAKIYEHSGGAFILENHLKVILEEDYLALAVNQNRVKQGNRGFLTNNTEKQTDISSQIVREVLIPEIEREVNEGKLFANLRQIYNALLLAMWYKDSLKTESFGMSYFDQGKIEGVKTADKKVTGKIYDQYIEAFEKGTLNLIKEDYDSTAKATIPRKYFSGGAAFDAATLSTVVVSMDIAWADRVRRPALVAVNFTPVCAVAAGCTFPEPAGSAFGASSAFGGRAAPTLAASLLALAAPGAAESPEESFFAEAVIPEEEQPETQTFTEIEEAIINVEVRSGRAETALQTAHETVQKLQAGEIEPSGTVSIYDVRDLDKDDPRIQDPAFWQRRVVGRLDRAVADSLGYFYGTSYIVAVDPAGEEIIAHRQTTSSGDIGFFGGHLLAGESPFQGAQRESAEEFPGYDLTNEPKLLFVEVVDIDGQPRKEVRFVWSRVLTSDEDRALREAAATLEKAKPRYTREDFLGTITPIKEMVSHAQKAARERDLGFWTAGGEVESVVRIPLSDAGRLPHKPYYRPDIDPESSLFVQNVGYLEVPLRYQGQPEGSTEEAFFTPDEAERVLSRIAGDRTVGEKLSGIVTTAKSQRSTSGRQPASPAVALQAEIRSEQTDSAAAPGGIDFNPDIGRVIIDNSPQKFRWHIDPAYRPFETVPMDGLKHNILFINPIPAQSIPLTFGLSVQEAADQLSSL